MLKTFSATLTPMITLFLCIIIGFTVKKLNIISDASRKVIAKLITWVFYPALSFSTMARSFTATTLTKHLSNILLSTVALFIAIPLAIILSGLFIRKKCYERGVYQYALAFGNSGYMGDPLVDAMFGTSVLSFYKIACLPITLGIYTWGMTTLVPADKAMKKGAWKKLITPPLVAMLIGMATGLISGAIVTDIPVGSSAYDVIFPKFLVSTIDSLKACMGPLAMILAGVTVASYDFFGMFKDKKVYFATALRLIILPAVILGALFGIKELANLAFGISLDNTAIILLFFAYAAPLGLNTIVFPEAYGGDPKTGASMTLISHTLCVITIPLMFSLLMALFGADTWLTI